MTHQEFDNTSFGQGQTVIYNGKEYPFMGADFEERLIAVDLFDNGEMSWVRCENCEVKD